MPRGKQRNYPAIELSRALAVARVIVDEASSQAVSKLTLAGLLDTTPTSSAFRDLVAASRLYGLTSGGINSDSFTVTALGEKSVGGDEVARDTALKRAVQNVTPYKRFIDAYVSKKIPAAAPLKDFMTGEGGVEVDRVDEATQFLLADLETAGFIVDMKGGKWVNTSGSAAAIGLAASSSAQGEAEAGDNFESEGDGQTEYDAPADTSTSGITNLQPRLKDRSLGTAKKVFIAHGKNRTPLDQLKKALDQFKVQYAVAVDEPNKGRPISKKVADLMELDCSSGIFIFTADEQFFKGDADNQQEVWRPSENVVFELGAASILYDTRIVIFKEKGVSFPSDFSDLGYIEFEKDQLVAELGALFSELVALDILEVRAKG